MPDDPGSRGGKGDKGKRPALRHGVIHPRVPLTPAQEERKSGPRPALDARVPPAGPPRRTTTSHPALRPDSRPRTTTTAQPAARPVRTQSSPSEPRAITGRMMALRLGTAESHQAVTREIEASAYDDDEVTQFDGVLNDGGWQRGGSPGDDDDDDEETVTELGFDGTTPSSKVTSRDVFKAVEAPVQSREGRRREDLYRTVIDQFAVGRNPRYEPDGPEQPRAHIFVWDVSRAMNAEIPKFIGGREQTLGLMCDWIRQEAPARGWRKVDATGALEAANAGMPVVVLPKEFRRKLMGMVRPGEMNIDGQPFVAAAGVERGNELSVREALGVGAVEYYFHL